MKTNLTMKPNLPAMHPNPNLQPIRDIMKKKSILGALRAILLGGGMLLAAHPVQADNTGTGGTITYTDADGLNPINTPIVGGYVVHTFTSSGTLLIPNAATADVLVVGGGGGGGGSNYTSGGGGAGGLIYSNGYTLINDSNYTVTVGAGGARAAGSNLAGGDGANSAFVALVAFGGGGGSVNPWPTVPSPGRNGGSGGGGCGGMAAKPGGTGVSGQGLAGGNGNNVAPEYAAGGGGGAGTNGANGTATAGGNGGDGLQYSISGTASWYAGGGGGSTFSGTGTLGLGGIGGGGASTATVGKDGQPNTGGGGGAALSQQSSASGSGGSGIVIVRYPYDTGGDVTPPTIVTLSPAADATNESPFGNLMVTFNEAIAIGTGNITIKNLTDATESTIDITDGGQVSVAGSVLTINPAADLLAGKSYAIRIAATAIKDTSDNFFAGIADDTTWNFATDGTPPTVVTLSPADDVIDGLDFGNLVVTFNEAIAIGTGNITIKNLTDATESTIDITDGGQVSVAGSVLTINPAADLLAGKSYAIRIAATAIKDTSDNFFAGIADDTTWNFTLVGSLKPFTGAGAGEGIDLAPSTDIVYALNLGGPTLSIQGQTFTGADVGAPPAGVSVTGGAQYNYGLTTDYGTNPSDGHNLDTMLSSAWYAPGAASSGAAMTIDLGVTAGQQYKLQLLLHEPWSGGQGNSTIRDFNILVENSAGSLVTGVQNFNPGAETNGSSQVGADFGLVYTYSFTAFDASFSVRLAQNETGKQNPIFSSLVLTQIPDGNSGYSDWALGPFLGTLSDTDPALDFDGGGLASAIEWVTGGDPTDSADDASVTPIFDNTTDPDFFIFTYRRSDLANTDQNTTIVVEYGSDLNGWTPAVDDATNVIITPTDEGGGAGIDLVQVKLKRSTLAIDNKLFARLKVIVAGL